jgi:hypothetical protein
VVECISVNRYEFLKIARADSGTTVVKLLVEVLKGNNATNELSFDECKNCDGAANSLAAAIAANKISCRYMSARFVMGQQKSWLKPLQLTDTLKR